MIVELAWGISMGQTWSVSDLNPHLHRSTPLVVVFRAEFEESNVDHKTAQESYWSSPCPAILDRL
jgi:hypothetical protein